MSQPCNHSWSEEIETCRTCEGTDIEEVEIETGSVLGGVLRVKTEPLYGSFCLSCEDLTMVSLARHCKICGAVDWLFTMDEDIFGN